MNREQLHQRVYEWAIIAVMCALPFSRWLSSVAVIVLAINWLWEGKLKGKLIALRSSMPALLMIIFFLISAAGIFYTGDKSLCSFVIQKKLGLLVFPLVLGSTKIYDESKLARLLWFFTGSIILASLYCVTIQLMHYVQSGNGGLLFYHNLVAPLNLHAVYFSVWVFVAIAFLVLPLSKVQSRLNRSLKTIAICWLTFFLFLLASKLIIIVFIVTVTGVALGNLIKGTSDKPLLLFWILSLTGALAISFTNNPIKARFGDIFQPSRFLVSTTSQINPVENLNDVSLRFILWNFGYEIIKEKNAWLLGISAGNSQHELDQKIKAAHMYTGTDGHSGYLGYNFHNQFIETAVQSGIAGLACLISILVGLLYYTVKFRNVLLLLLLLAFVCFFLTESVLERQWGVITFALLSMVFVNLNVPWQLQSSK